MAARAMWKGVVRIGGTKLPVKLYSAVQDHTIHFRLLHKTDEAPVKQQMVDSETGDAVDFKDAKKAFPVMRNRMVLIEKEEIEKLEPKESRDIEVKRFVDPADIDHRWFERAYYLGPDGDSGAYFALAEALKKKNKEGVARWVMRKKDYVGALREHDGYLVLIVLRYAEEVVDSSALPRPEGRPLLAKEIAMGEQLVEALAGEFDPSQFRDEYRDRVMDLIRTKERGGKVKVTTFRPKKTADDALTGALAASLSGLRKKSA
ncbi:MAG: non-homologous end joining protein Ku [Thermoanaerobaculia bacterium]